MCVPVCAEGVSSRSIVCARKNLRGIEFSLRQKLGLQIKGKSPPFPWAKSYGKLPSNSRPDFLDPTTLLIVYQHAIISEHIFEI